MSKVWFTADLHLGAFDAVTYNGRPFGDIDEMAEALISNWNACVDDEDEVFVLGDFADREADFIDAHARLKGNKHYLFGNHDPWRRGDPEESRAVLPGATVYANEGVWVKRGGMKLILAHYPFAAWPSAWIHLHGHLHGGRSPLHAHEDYTYGYPHRVDVGVDAWEFRPVELAQIVSHLGDQECRCRGRVW